MGWRRAARLPDSHADPAQNKLDEVGRCARKGGESGPDRDGGANDHGPVSSLGELGQGDPKNGVEEREGEAAHHAQLPVCQLQLVLDGLGQDVDH